MVAIARGFHLLPFRTEKLSPSALMVLGYKARESRSLPFFSSSLTSIQSCQAFFIYVLLQVRFWIARYLRDRFVERIFAHLILVSVMIAIVEIAGQQFKVEKDQELFVHKLDGSAGDKVTFEQVHLIEKEGKVSIGNPILGKAQVKATILEHRKGDKVTVFKKKRRKGYKVRRGHRQHFTKIKVDSIAG